MKTLGKSYLKLRYVIASAMLMASFAAAGQAEAACDPATSSANPVINTTVTCTGSTINQNVNNGYGVTEDKGNTINVQSGASVNGTNFGIEINNVSFANPETINNSGTISGVSGIRGGFGTVNNKAGATVTGSGVFGIEIVGTGVVTNSGSISGVSAGIILQNGEVTNTSTGIVAGVTNGIEIIDVAKVSNAGAVSGGQFGINIRAGLSRPFADILNSGTIQGGNSGIISLKALNITNSGNIFGLDTTGFGIASATDITVTNAGAGTISGGAAGIGINAGTARVLNAGSITATSLNGSGIVASAATVDNSGAISGSGVAISVFDADVINRAAASIVGGTAGIDAANVKLDNAGTISGTDPTGSGVFAGNTVNLINRNTGVISGVANGIATTGTAVVDNSGKIQATGVGSTGIFGQTLADVINRMGGTISGAIFGVLSSNVKVDNFGAISGLNAIQGDVVAVNNAGTVIGAANGITTDSVATVTNARTGTISGGQVGIIADNARVTNFGTISGGVGIQSNDAAAIVNSGAIIGTGGTAIQLSSAADTLTFLAGSRIVGVVDMGFGNDVVNVAVVAPSSKVSSLTTVNLPPAWTSPAPITVWANSFGGQRIQDATVDTLRATSTAWAGAIGIDRKMLSSAAAAAGFRSISTRKP